MKKISRILTFTTSIVIIIYSAIFSFFQFDNSFNAQYRHIFAGYPIMRDLFNLHRPGDGVRDLLDRKKYPKMVIEVVETNDLKFRIETINSIEKNLGELLEKNIEVRSRKLNSNAIKYTDNDLLKFASSNREIKPKSGQAALFIALLSYHSEKSEQVGTTLNEVGLAVFATPFNDLSESESSKLFETTIYHELGHLLGLQHREGSVMDEDVEVGIGVGAQEYQWFSTSELNAIERNKTKYR